MGHSKYKEGENIGPYNIKLLQRTKRVGRAYYGLFKCSFCGKDFETKISNIVEGNTRSCGCLYPRKPPTEKNEDLSGRKFGKLTVQKLETESTKERRGRFWICLCECGTTIICPTCSLTSHKTTSCGCIKSYGEMKIKQFLDKYNIPFIQEATFHSLKSERGVCLRFDFYLPNRDILIECQGKQHYEAVPFFGGDEAFQSSQNHDKMKRQWCQDNGKKLIEIPYFKKKDIQEDELSSLLGLK